MKRRGSGCLSFIVAAIAILVIVLCVRFVWDDATRVQRSQQEPPPRSEPQVPQVSRGRNRVLRSASNSDILVCRTEDDLRRLMKLLNAGDDYGVAEMVATGRAWWVTAGTRAVMIDEGVMVSEVRVVEGSHTGKAGFVPAEFAR